MQSAATAIDPARRGVAFGDNLLTYDRLILSPGIDIAWGALPGYDEAAAERMPHAWKAGEQTLLLRRQLEAMPDGGVVVISAPANPYRCPPGPYERASLIADYLKTHKPRSKLLLLDAKDIFSKQKLFQAAWKELYPGLLEWVSLSDGGKVTRVDPATNTFETDFGSHKADVANVIPPQRAGAIAAAAGVVDRTGWCPIDPVTFESKLQPGIHVIGDAAIAGAMPKSAFAANAQAKVCADAVAQLLAGNAPAEPRLINTCYSLVAPGNAISVAGVYRPLNGQLTDIEGAGGTSSARTRRPNSAPRKPNTPMPGSRRSPARRSADALALLLGGAMIAAAGDAMDTPLTAQPGDPARGGQIVENRQLSACLLCHAGPFPAPHLQGTIGPSLEGVGSRLSAGQIRLRLIDARKLNPDTVMPPYYVVDGLNRAGRAWQGRPALSAQQIEDVVAFLTTLRAP